MIGQARTDLRNLVATIPDVVVHREVPEQIAPPCIVIQPADPFVFEQLPGPDGLTFTESHVISFEVILLVELSEEHGNKAASDKLDGMIEDLLEVLRPSPWWLDSMGQPGAQFTTDWLCHGQRVTVQSAVQL